MLLSEIIDETIKKLDYYNFNHRQFMHDFAVVIKSPSAVSGRQLEVLKGIANGLTVKEIAVSMDISIKTVEAHKYNLCRRLQISGVANLTRYAVANRLVPNSFQT